MPCFQRFHGVGLLGLALVSLGCSEKSFSVPAAATGNPTEEQTREFFRVIKDVNEEQQFLAWATASLYEPKASPEDWARAVSRLLGAQIAATQRPPPEDPRLKQVQAPACTARNLTDPAERPGSFVASVEGPNCPIRWSNHVTVTLGPQIHTRQRMSYAVRSESLRRESRIVGYDFAVEKAVTRTGLGSASVMTGKEQLTGFVELSDRRVLHVASTFESATPVSGGTSSSTLSFSLTSSDYGGELRSEQEGSGTRYSFNGTAVPADWLVAHLGGTILRLPWGWITAEPK